MDRLVGLLGIAFLLGLCWAASKHRQAVRWKIVAWGMGIQFASALIILKSPPGYWVFRKISDAVHVLIGFTGEGAKFIWGPLYDPGSDNGVFFVNVLMTIIFFSALMSLLYHLGVMKWLVSGIAWAMRRTMGTSGSETLSASANIFVGQTEAPLVVRPFVEKMTLSELHAVMVGGFATVAGGVLLAYVSFGMDAGHLVAASFMSAPAALVAAKMLYPETETSPTAGDTEIVLEKTSANVFDAACTGAADGMKLVLNVAAMLVAFLALIAMLNYLFALPFGLFGAEPLRIETLLGWGFAPVAWLVGVPWTDCTKIGELMGLRMVANEFLSFMKLRDMEVSPRTYVIATYAFCGFANFGSIAVQIGGIATIAPSRRADLARLGLRAMLAGTIASLLTASLAGILLSDHQVERDFRINRVRVASTVEEKVRHCDAFLEKYPDSPYAETFRELKRAAPEKNP